MDKVLESSRISMQTVSTIGIAVHRHGGHVGLLYRINREEPVEILHLCGHLELKSEVPSRGYACWVRPTFQSLRAKAIAAFCRRVWKQNRNGRVPYGLSKPGQFFDFSSGKLLARGPAKVGLTCASFVLEIFNQTGFPLVKYEDWPDPSKEDIKKQRAYLKEIKRDYPNEVEHAKAFEAEIGNIRYTPLQVAGAGTADVPPVDYAYASDIAAKIHDLLKRLSTSAN